MRESEFRAALQNSLWRRVRCVVLWLPRTRPCWSTTWPRYSLQTTCFLLCEPQHAAFPHSALTKHLINIAAGSVFYNTVTLL